MTADPSFLIQLKAARETMRPSEQRLADLVLATPDAAVEWTMDEIAGRAEVSAPTVVRFCNAVGCRGFRDFKLKLARDRGTAQHFAHPDVDADDPPETVARKIVDGAIAALIDVRRDLRPEEVAAAAAILARAARIEFYGSGNSGIVAQDMQHKIFRLGMPTVAYADPHVFCMSATTLAPGDAVVAISNSGRTEDVLEAAREARAVGADVIAVTRGGSPLAELATATIAVSVSEDSEVYSPMASRLAHLVVGDMLAVAVAQLKGDIAWSRLQRAKEAVRRRRRIPG